MKINGSGCPIYRCSITSSTHDIAPLDHVHVNNYDSVCPWSYKMLSNQTRPTSARRPPALRVITYCFSARKQPTLNQYRKCSWPLRPQEKKSAKVEPAVSCIRKDFSMQCTSMRTKSFDIPFHSVEYQSYSHFFRKYRDNVWHPLMGRYTAFYSNTGRSPTPIKQGAVWLRIDRAPAVC